MNPVTVIALCSLVISVLTTVIMLFGQRRTATTDYVAQLEAKVKALENELAKCEERVKVLENTNGSLLKENIELLRQIARERA